MREKTLENKKPKFQSWLKKFLRQLEKDEKWVREERMREHKILMARLEE